MFEATLGYILRLFPNKTTTKSVFHSHRIFKEVVLLTDIALLARGVKCSYSLESKPLILLLIGRICTNGM